MIDGTIEMACLRRLITCNVGCRSVMAREANGVQIKQKLRVRVSHYCKA
jgi:hypothetical protein